MYRYKKAVKKRIEDFLHKSGEYSNMVYDEHHITLFLIENSMFFSKNDLKRIFRFIMNLSDPNCLVSLVRMKEMFSEENMDDLVKAILNSKDMESIFICSMYIKFDELTLNKIKEWLIASGDYKGLYDYISHTKGLSEGQREELMMLCAKNVSYGFYKEVMERFRINYRSDDYLNKMFINILQTKNLYKIAYFLYLNPNEEYINTVFGTFDNYFAFCITNHKKLDIKKERLYEQKERFEYNRDFSFVDANIEKALAKEKQKKDN